MIKRAIHDSTVFTTFPFFTEGVFRKTIIVSNQEVLVEIKDTIKGVSKSFIKNYTDL